MPLGAPHWDAAARVMQELLTHPLVIPFITRHVSDNSSESEQSPDIVGSSLDLATILSRISTGKYLTISVWLSEVEQVWARYEATHPGPLHTAVTNECRRIFEVILRGSGVYPIAEWCPDGRELHSRLLRKLRTVPDKYRKTLFPKHGPGQNALIRPSQDELIELAKGLTDLSKADRCNALLILADCGDLPVHGAADQVVELANLKAETIHELQAFVESVQNRE
jgi:hypothetical protein